MPDAKQHTLPKQLKTMPDGPGPDIEDWTSALQHLQQGSRSQYSIRLYAWAKKYVAVGKKRISLEQLRKVLGLESAKDAEGNVIQEAPLPVWANFRQRALDTAMAEITKKTDLKIAIKSLERSKHRRVTSVTFVIKGASGAGG